MLEAQWMGSSKKNSFNFKEQVVSLAYNAHTISSRGLQINPELNRWSNLRWVHQLLICQDVTCYIFQYQLQPLFSAPTIQIPKDLAYLLDQYPQVFQEPASLPPQREVHHKISLVTGTKPLSLRPYHYTRHLKNEFENIIKDMLK